MTSVTFMSRCPLNVSCGFRAFQRWLDKECVMLGLRVGDCGLNALTAVSVS